MKVITAKLKATVKVTFKDEKSETEMYKSAYANKEDVFIVYSKNVPSDEGYFVKVDGKYKAVEI